MPSRLSLNTLRAQVLEATQSGNRLTPAEAQQIIANNGGPLDAAQRTLVETLVAQPGLYENDEARRSVAATFSVYVPPALPGAGGKVEEKLLKALTELPGKAVFANVDLKLAELVETAPVGGGLARTGVKVDVGWQVLPPGDPDFRARAAATTRLEQGVNDVAWVKTRGGLFPTAGFNAAVPLPGIGALTFGFDANASVRTETLFPYAFNTTSLAGLGKTVGQAAVDIAKNSTSGLPLSAAKARELPEGARVRIEGHGQLAVNAGLGLGRQLSLVNGLVNLGVGAGVNLGTSLSQSGNVALTVDRLEGDKVMVSVDFAQTRTDSVNGSVTVGLTADLNGGMPVIGNGQVADVFRRGTDVLADKLESELAKWSVNAGASTTAWSTTSTKQRFVLDLANPDAAATYERLVRLNVGAADTAASLEGSGVTVARLDETTNGRTDAQGIRFGSLNLLRAIATRTTTRGTVEDSRGQSITYDRAKLERDYSGLVTDIFRGARSSSAELVTTEQAGQRQSYLRITHNITDDQRTTGGDLQKFIELGRMLEASGNTPPALETARQRDDNIGRTTRKLDVYVNDAGLAALTDVSDERLMLTYANALWLLEMKPDETVPWLIDDRRRGDVMYLLTKPTLDPGGDGGQNDTSEYWRMTRRSLPDDRERYQAWQRFSEKVQQVRTAGTPRARVEAFAGARLPLDPTVELATLATLAGNTNVLLSNLSLDAQNAALSVSYTSEGGIADPAAAVEGLLNNAGRT